MWKHKKKINCYHVKIYKLGYTLHGHDMELLTVLNYSSGKIESRIPYVSELQYLYVHKIQK
jgi:hypothetical protein